MAPSWFRLFWGFIFVSHNMPQSFLIDSILLRSWMYVCDLISTRFFASTHLFSNLHNAKYAKTYAKKFIIIVSLIIIHSSQIHSFLGRATLIILNLSLWCDSLCVLKRNEGYNDMKDQIKNRISNWYKLIWHVYLK